MFRFGWLRKGKKEEEAPKEDKSQAMWAAIVALQAQYWMPNPTELGKLYLEYKNKNLNLAQLYRFHHLVCMEVLQEAGYTDGEYEGKYGALLQETAELLLSSQSPFRIAQGAFWLEDNHTETPDARVRFVNMSLTHLGALELIQVDAEHNPIGLTFVPFDEIKAIELTGKGLVKGCRITYEGEARRQELFWLPLLYGQSQHSPHERDRSGQSTRFAAKLLLPSQGVQFGIGLGQQDLGMVQDNEQRFRLVGLRYLRLGITILDPNDPRFEEKRKGREDTA